MARSSSAVEPRRRGRPLTHPWDKVGARANGMVFTANEDGLIDGVSESAFRSAASAYARRHGQKAEVRKTRTGGLRVQFVAQGDAVSA